MPRTNFYTAPSKPPQTRWARHIDAWMRDKGKSQTGAYRTLGKAVGLGSNSRSAFLPYLYDKEPDEEHAKALAAIIGWPPEPAPEPAEATETPDPLVSALQAQTEALTALVAELRDWRIADRDRLAAVERTAEQLVARLLPVLEGGGSQEQHVHGRSAR